MLNHDIITFVLQIEGLKEKQKKVMNSIASFSNENGISECSKQEIADEAKVSTRTVTNIIDQLEALGHITPLHKSGQKGKYAINNLPEQGKSFNKKQSIRTPIIKAITKLNLAYREDTVFKAWSKYASKAGNNIYPTEDRIAHDTELSLFSVQESTRWLIQTGFMLPDDCISPYGAPRKGYYIPGWNLDTQTIEVSSQQLQEVKKLRDRRHMNIDDHIEEIEENEDWLDDFGKDSDLTAEPARADTPAHPQSKPEQEKDATIIAKTVTTKDGEKITLSSLNDGNTSFIDNTTIRTQPGVILTPALIAVPKEKTQPQKPKTPIRTFDKNGKMTYAAYLQAMDTRDNCMKRQQQAQELLETDLPEDERVKTQSSIRMLQARIKVAQQSIEKYEKEQKEKTEQTPEEQPKKKEHWSYIDGKWQKHTHEQLQSNPYFKTDRPTRIDRYKLDKELKLKSEQTAKEGTSNDE